MKKEIKQKLVFKGATFKKEADFKNLIFTQDAEFSNAKFEDNVYFNNTEFKKEADFHESEYGRIACFYKTSFEEIPNFSSSVFFSSSKLNLINSTLSKPSYSFGDLKEKIEEKIPKPEDSNDKKEKRNLKREWLEKREKNADDFRDSFRGFKSVLIKDNNLLDAQEHHRIELYCKELELEFSDEARVDKDSGKKDAWKTKIDRYQLMFYRLTSEHHTDLLKIFNNIILLMALFGMFVFGLMELKSCCVSVQMGCETKCANTLFLSERKISYFVFDDLEKLYNSELTLWLFFIPYALFVVFYICLFLKSFFDRKEIKKGIRMIVWMSIWMIGGCVALLIDFGIGYFVSPLSETLLLLVEAFMIFLLCLVFVLMYLGLMLNRNWVLTLYSYLVCIVILVVKPAILFPLFGKLIDESLNINYPAIKSLGVVYCILLFLLLFSLQKTARKNSIVPS